MSYRLFKRASDSMYKGLGLGLFVAIWTLMVANLFGDRWTYLEITGLLWVLAGAAARATQLQGPELKLEAAPAFVGAGIPPIGSTGI
jgi:hypothetical protein